MWDETKLNELKIMRRKYEAKRIEAAADINKKLYEIDSDINKEQIKKIEWERNQKQLGKVSYMNIIFFWDNGVRFDTRDKKDTILKFKDFVLYYGLPTSYEIRS